jgi:hypothetical protein
VGKLLGTIAPPLYVPQGFFANDMKVRIGYPDRKEGWTNLYSAAERLYSIDSAGAEARWTEEDIPLFWRTRISKIDVNPNQDTELLKHARDAAFLAMTRIPLKAHGHEFITECHPREYFKNHLYFG